MSGKILRQGIFGYINVLILILIYFTFHWSYTDVELVMYTFSIINKTTVHKLCLIVVSQDRYINI